jgi:probable addiction module antidote protein
MAIETTPFDTAEYLDSPEMIAAYLEAVLEEGDSSMIAVALGNIARAKGMAQIARDAGVTRDSLYKSLKEGGNPTISTFLGVLKGLGMGLSVHPLNAASAGTAAASGARSVG